MRLLFELLLFAVLVFFFAGFALVFYKWLSRKFLPPPKKVNLHQEQIEARAEEKEMEGYQK